MCKCSPLAPQKDSLVLNSDGRGASYSLPCVAERWRVVIAAETLVLQIWKWCRLGQSGVAKERAKQAVYMLS